MKQERGRARWGWKMLLLAALLVCVVSVVVQVFWPGKKFMIFTQVGGVDVSELTREEAQEKLVSIFDGHELAVEDRGGYEMTRVDVDIDQIDIAGMMNEELSYPFWQRIIPFSSFVRVLNSHWVGAKVNLDESAILASISAEPVNARADMADGEVDVVEARNGFVVNKEDFERRLSEVRLGADGETIVKVEAERKSYRVGTEGVEKYAEKLPEIDEEMLANFRGRQLSVYAEGMDGLWSLGRNADRVMTAASTYKLFVAYYVLSLVESRDITWEAVESCMRLMIVESDNSCPMGWLSEYGYDTITHYAREMGAMNTNFAPHNMQTSARDLGLLLTKLYRGEILTEELSGRLIGYMKEQKHRWGIPDGVSPLAVANKPGWLDGEDIYNDAGIVYATSGDYVVVIMTVGLSRTGVAEVAKTINKLY